jgi:hypothetical protein
MRLPANMSAPHMAIAIDALASIVLIDEMGEMQVLNTSSQAWSSTSWHPSVPGRIAAAQLVRARYIIVTMETRIDVFDAYNVSRPGGSGSLLVDRLTTASCLDPRTNTMLIVGGKSTNSTCLDTIERIDVQDSGDVMAPIVTAGSGRLQQARYDHALLRANGLLFAVGGVFQPNATSLTFLDTMEASSNNGDSWYILAARLVRGRTASCMAVALDRYVVIAGGAYLDPYNTTDQIDVIDATTQQHVATLHLRERRLGCFAGALGPFVYMGGGLSADLFSSRVLNSVEVLDVRDVTLFYAANLTDNQQDSAVAETRDAVYFMGGDASMVIDYYQCGNGRIDPGEVCDVNDADCFKNCTGRRAAQPTASTPPPATKAASRSGTCAVVSALVALLHARMHM